MNAIMEIDEVFIITMDIKFCLCELLFIISIHRMQMSWSGKDSGHVTLLARWMSVI